MRRLTVLLAALLLGSLLALPAVGGGAKVETIRDFDSVFAVAEADNIFGVLLMNAHCDFLKRVEYPNGSAKETMSCRVTNGDGFPDDIAGTVPNKAYTESGGECIWFSDYWVNQDEPQAIYGSRYSEVVTPSGKAHATIWYAADPLTEEDCFGPIPEE